MMKGKGIRREGKNAESRAKAEFFSVLDVFKYFEKNPTRLVEYVETALEKSNSIPGFHIAQLARTVGMQLKAGDQVFEKMPETFVKPSRFDNIGLILTMARAQFPRPLSA